MPAFSGQSIGSGGVLENCSVGLIGKCKTCLYTLACKLLYSTSCEFCGSVNHQYCCDYVAMPFKDWLTEEAQKLPCYPIAHGIRGQELIMR